MAIYANENGTVKDLTPFSTGAIKILRLTASINSSTQEDITDLINANGIPDHILIFSHYFDWYSAGSNSGVCHLYWHLQNSDAFFDRIVQSVYHQGNSGVSESINDFSTSFNSNSVYTTIDIRTSTTTKYIKSTGDDITVLMIWE